MGLVDYGSDSDSDSGSPPPPSKASTSTSLPPPAKGLSLPPPTASSSSLKLPPASNGSAPPKVPAKKSKGPVRILLDVPPPSASSSTPEEPPAKKPKLSLGGGGGKLNGLAAMLPAPKNEAPAPKAAAPVSAPPLKASAPAGMEGLDNLLGELEGKKDGTSGGGMFVPHSMKGKKPAAPAPAKAQPDPGMDFFGLGSVASTSAPSAAPKSHLSTISSAPSLSSAPTPSSSKPNSTPSADDPYPGFTQLPNGQWVANNQETYDLWVSQVGLDGQGGGVPSAVEEAPRGFGARAVANARDLSEEAARRREAWEKRPDAFGKEREKEEEKKINIGGKKVAVGRARRTGQLSALLADAQDRRAELEERIAQGKNNRKAAGNKYGF